jgi:hypothetical protein
MAAKDSLHPQQFLHGSPVRIETGGEILPATKVSTPEHIASRDKANDDYQPNRVYMAPHPITAFQYTWTKEDYENKNEQPSGYIHVVEPIGKVMVDRSSRSAQIAGSRHARGARVVGSFPAKAVVTGKVDTQEEQQVFQNYMKNRYGS